MTNISPSSVSADPDQLHEVPGMRWRPGIDDTHMDLMDGHLVPNLTSGPALVRSLWMRFDLHLQAQRMVEGPERFTPLLIEAGAQVAANQLEAAEIEILGEVSRGETRQGEEPSRTTPRTADERGKNR
jgi:ribulose-phosphate 3-epimerase